MKTQRINAYRAGDRIIYFREELGPRSLDWVTVGDPTESYEYIQTEVQLFNLKELRKELEEREDVK